MKITPLFVLLGALFIAIYLGTLNPSPYSSSNANNNINSNSHNDDDTQPLINPRISDPHILQWRENHYQQPGIFLQTFSKQRALLINLGPRPTSGYHVAIQSVTLRNGTWQVKYRAMPPEPGVILTQVITYPHSLILLPSDSYPVQIWEQTKTGAKSCRINPTTAPSSNHHQLNY